MIKNKFKKISDTSLSTFHQISYRKLPLFFLKWRGKQLSKHHNKLNNKADFGVGGKKEALARRAERKPSWGSQFLTASLRKYCFFFVRQRETERDGRTDRQTERYLRFQWA